MGRLIIDGNSVFEIDEECMKKRKIPASCELEKYYKNDTLSLKKNTDKNSKKKE